jgi:hypothetical protein
MIRDLLELRPLHLTITKPPHETTSAEAEEQFRELMDRMPSFLAYIESVLEAEGINLSKEPTQVMNDVGEWLVSKSEPRRFAADQWLALRWRSFGGPVSSVQECGVLDWNALR